MDLKAVKSNAYLFACGLYIAAAIVFSSVWGTKPELHLVFTAARGIAYLLILAKLGHDFLTRKISPRHLIVMGLVGAFLLLSAYVTKNKNPLIYWVFIIAGHDIDYRRIIRAALLGHLAGLLLVITSCYAGFVENIEFIRTEGTVRQSLGFTYTTAAANYFFYTVLLWGVWRQKNISFAELALLLAVDAFFFITTDTKSAFALTLLYILLLFVLKMVEKLREFHSWYFIPALLIAPLCAAFIVWLCAKYDPEVTWMSRLNGLLTNRLRWGHAGFQSFGVHPLGQFIEWNGMDKDYAAYNYVDSSFVQILLNFGPVFLLLLLAGMMLYAFSICRSRNSYLLLAYLLFVVHSTFDPQLILIAYNSFWLAYGFVSENVRRRDISYA